MKRQACITITASLTLMFIVGMIMMILGGIRYADESREISASNGHHGICKVIDVLDYDDRFIVRFSWFERYHYEQKIMYDDNIGPDNFTVGALVDCWSRDFSEYTSVVVQRFSHDGRTVSILSIGIIYTILFMFYTSTLAIVVCCRVAKNKLHEDRTKNLNPDTSVNDDYGACERHNDQAPNA